MTREALTTAQIFRFGPDDKTCLNHLFEVRFKKSFECTKCGRASKWFRIKAERAYSYQWCSHHLHPATGIPFEKTRTPFQLWLYAIHLFTGAHHGMSGKELERQLGATHNTAWRTRMLIREHMIDLNDNGPIVGEGTSVEIDETLMGGVKRGNHNRGSAAKAVVVGSNVRIIGNDRHDELRCFVCLSARNSHARSNHGAMEYAYFDYRLTETVTANRI